MSKNVFIRGEKVICRYEYLGYFYPGKSNGQSTCFGRVSNQML